MEFANQPRPQSPTGDIGMLRDKMVRDCAKEVSLAQVSCTVMYAYVAPPTLVGAWSMVLGLRRHIEWY